MAKSPTFTEWLTSERGLGERAARDVKSRCTRVEKMTGVSLDTELAKPNGLEGALVRITKNAPDELLPDGKNRTVMSQLRRAVRLYDEFKQSAASPQARH